MKTIALAVLILTLPVLLTSTPAPEGVQGHLATCPHCSDLEFNPIRCSAAMEISRPASDADRELHASKPSDANAGPRKAGLVASRS